MGISTQRLLSISSATRLMTPGQRVEKGGGGGINLSKQQQRFEQGGVACALLLNTPYSPSPGISLVTSP